MIKQTLHVVSSLCYRGILRPALHQMGLQDEIIYLPIDLSICYIPKDFSDTELRMAVASVESERATFQERDNWFNELKNFIKTDFSLYEKIIVWHGWSATDLLLLYLMSTLAGDNLYHVDITSCVDFMKKHRFSPFLDMGYVCADDIFTLNMLSFAKKITDEEKDEYITQWNRWKNSTAPYRLFNIQTGIIEEYPADFMDDTIIKYAKEGPKLIRLVGKVKEYDYPFISDSIIFKRIRDLYWEHKLDFAVLVRNP